MKALLVIIGIVLAFLILPRIAGDTESNVFNVEYYNSCTEKITKFFGNETGYYCDCTLDYLNDHYKPAQLMSMTVTMETEAMLACL